MNNYEAKFVTSIKKLSELVKNAKKIDERKKDDFCLNDLENEINNL